MYGGQVNPQVDKYDTKQLLSALPKESDLDEKLRVFGKDLEFKATEIAHRTVKRALAE
jgi:hypothetical protein